ncbi:MAG: molybdenum cofactor guanylyltransferase [Anaerolineales bacterium]|nr:molybdenum cofactor guanylyltransferase [Anaerolineales bacterium]
MLTLVVQSGGLSARMGEDKALKKFLGKPLVQHVIERLASIADEIVVTTNRPDDYEFLNLRLAPDLKPNRGALGGLYTAIASATNPLVGVVACDMPFASGKLFEGAASIMDAENADVVIAKTDRGYEPFHALYRRETCLPAIESAIEADLWKVIAWFPQVRVRTLSADEIKTFDPSGLCFNNLNTPEEFAEAEKTAERFYRTIKTGQGA